MRITLAFNLKRERTEADAELLSEEDVERLLSGLRKLGHAVTPVEVSGPADKMIGRLLDSRPELIFNVAEGTDGPMREAIYPAIYKHLGLPFRGPWGSDQGNLLIFKKKHPSKGQYFPL